MRRFVHSCLLFVAALGSHSALAHPAWVTECDEVRGVGYNTHSTGTYLIPYPNGQTPWGFACRTARPRRAATLPGGAGVLVHFCEGPRNVQHTFENFAVEEGFGTTHWLQACSRIHAVRVRPAGPGCPLTFPALRCLSPRGLRADYQVAGRLIPGYPTQNPGMDYATVCEGVELVDVCAL